VTFLAIDIGNTRLKWGLFDALTKNASLLASGVCFLEHVDRLADEQWSTLAAQFGAPQRVLGCCVAGDALRRRTEEQLEIFDTTPQWVVASLSECGVSNGYDSPTRLGADRWVAMVGARAHMLARMQEPKYTAKFIGPRPLVVVMVGTAVTVEAVDAEGKFLGGLILPGHGIMLKSLQAGTAGLHVPTGEVRDFPTNTSDALTSGGTYAIAGAIERMYSALQHRCGSKPWCYVAGGAGWKMTQHIPVPHELIESLVFEGLLVIGADRWGAENA
jgi:type III pantothenate kinase